MSGQKSTSKTFAVGQTANELALQDINLQLSQSAVEAFGGLFGQIGAGAGEGLDRFGFGQIEDVGRAVGGAEQAGFIRDEFGRAQAGAEGAEQLRQFETDRILGGDPRLGLTPEQEASITAASRAAFETGSADIDAARLGALRDVREELAPSRGLRPSDTPIVDRGQLIAQESLRATGRLRSTIAGQEAAARISLPLESGRLGIESSRLRQAASQFQQTQARGGTDIQNFLRSQAFTNRLNLQSGAGQLAISGAQTPLAAQEAFKPVLAQKSRASGGGVL